MTVYLRNSHAKRVVYLPIRPGWYRVLKPAVTTAVPAALLHTGPVRKLLHRGMLDVVDGAAWDPDVRQRRASRIDMVRAIAAAEQREFDRLLADMPRRQHYWSAERIERLRARIVAGVTMRELADEFGLSRQAIGQVVQRHGLQHVRPGASGRLPSIGCSRDNRSVPGATRPDPTSGAQICGHRNGRNGSGSVGRRARPVSRSRPSWA